MSDELELLSAKMPTHTKLGNVQHWGQLHGTALAIAVSKAVETQTSSSLVICSSPQEAYQIENALRIFLKPEDKHRVIHFPDWETLPYDNFSPHQDIVSERLRALNRLVKGENIIAVASIQTLLQRICPKSYILGENLILRVGERINVSQLKKQLIESGYRRVDEVFTHGDFAIRGSIIDLYPTGNNIAVRLDLFDDEIETIRVFDPSTQRSADPVDEIELLKAFEFPLDEKGINTFRQNWRGQFSGDPQKCTVYCDISEQIPSPGCEYYLPLFFEQTATLIDYLDDNSLICQLGELQKPIDDFLTEVNNRYEQFAHDIEHPILKPNALYLRSNEFFASLKNFNSTCLHNYPLKEHSGNYNFKVSKCPELPIEASKEQPLAHLKIFLNSFAGRVLFCAESSGRREVLLELLAKANIKPDSYDNWHEYIRSDCNCGLIIASIENSALIDGNLAVIAEPTLFGSRIFQKRRRKRRQEESEALVKNLTELAIDAPVVHTEHGIGLYKGLKSLTVDGINKEFLMLEYANNSKLYVPVSSLHLINRYTGPDGSQAPINRLGTGQWEKSKRKAIEQIRDVAAELLSLQAKRQSRKGYAFLQDKEAYALFSHGFKFEETPDQERAIQDVLNDLASSRPMDRLVCGDVGFGKTEVAIRAAFTAANGGKQVAILVPTTLLAEQHYSSFKDRFADWPIEVEVLSRFGSGKNTQSVLTRLSEGKIDIIIGTHKLLSAQINFKSLGLLIIDEEHRFGVKQKEKLKSLRADVDILTLTATPIPRTLNMAISGIRDLSIISTPPEKRLAVKTFVRVQNDGLIREAILREIMRGGQVYYLHNDVESIERVARTIEKLVPEARVGVGHGQMREKLLEQTMADFYHRRFNVLVCTTIIETGIDIPTANTIIIDRADKFGLAALHQLRGRVGRSHHQAYAYLFTPNPKAISDKAKKRLEAIESIDTLGAGYMLATHDLEIRGAGELLGENQSGQVQTVGFTLYMDMLERAVKSIQAGSEIDVDSIDEGSVEIDCQLPALIPDELIPDVHMRLVFYKRIANASTEEQLQSLKVEFIDRFGMLPQATKNLFRLTEIKLFAETIGVKKVDMNKAGGKIEFKTKANVNPEALLDLIQNKSRIYRLVGPTQLRFQADLQDNEQRITFLQKLLSKLALDEIASIG